MISLLLSLVLISQVGGRTDTGTIRGVLQTEDGKPLQQGVRVAVVVAPEAGAADAGSDLLSLAETNASGEYLLENVPPGRYYVIAGSISLPTYYPGTIERERATPVSVTAGATLRNFDFKITSDSVRTAQATRQAGIRGGILTSTAVPAQTFAGKVRVEGASPSTASGVVIVARRKDGQTAQASVTPDGAFALRLPYGEYNISIPLIPLGHTVTSVAAGAANLLKEPLVSQSTTGSPPGIEITLKPPRPKFSIRGRIADSGAVRLDLRESGVLVQRSFLAADGTYEFRGLAPGAYDIDVVLDGRKLLTRRVTLTDQDANLDLVLGGQ